MRERGGRRYGSVIFFSWFVGFLLHRVSFTKGGGHVRTTFRLAIQSGIIEPRSFKKKISFLSQEGGERGDEK